MSGSEEVSDLLSRRVSSVAKSLRSTRSWLSIGGSLIAVIAAAFIGLSSWPPTSWQTLVMVGAIVGAGLAALGSFLELTSREDPTEAIDQARRQLVAAESFERLAAERQSKLRDYDKAVTQLKSLYLMILSCRGTIEQAMSHREFSATDLIDRCLTDCKHDFRIALGVKTEDYWTICVYRTETSAKYDRPYLKCFAHQRSVDCELEHAREWPLGSGIGGVALAQNREMFVPDTLSSEVGSAYELVRGQKKPEDDEKYRSMVAVPISVGEESLPWGIIIVTSSAPRHFGSTAMIGLPPEEAVRAFAGIVALAVLGSNGGKS